jgi:UDPglucose 6-dehydrogenase
MQEVSIGLDNRIGTKFLHAGSRLRRLLPPEGHPRADQDRAGLSRAAAHRDSVLAVNENRNRAMARKVSHVLGGGLRGKTIAVLGLIFEPDTETCEMRRSPRDGSSRHGREGACL